MGHLELIRANDIRIKLTKVQILLKQARGLAEKERDMVLERINLVINQILQYQDKYIKTLLEEQESKQLTIQAPKKNGNSNSHKSKSQVPTTQKMFSENPFETRQKTDSLINDINVPNDNIFSENPFQNILDQAEDIIDHGIEGQGELLLNQLYKAKALLELTEMESELTITKKLYSCIVHKGPIKGAAYICPRCSAFYCFKCANTLKQQGDTCWSCQYGYRIDLL